MKHLCKLLLLCLLMANIGLAQGNLVPNPSFEDTVSCPYAADDLAAALNWYNASGSPDYFHPCANSITPQNGVPQNTAGFQVPYYGVAYAGVGTYTTSYPNIREYIGIILQQPLVIGTEYFVSAYISKGDASTINWNIDCATNKFGFRFSTSKYDEFVLTFAPPDNYSHVYSDEVVTDSINWTQISGSFIADSAYTYLRMGNFYDMNNTIITPCEGDAYYFIDNVCVSTDSLICEITTAVGPAHKKNTISVSPNPAQNFITIDFPALTGSYDVSILDLKGRIVLPTTESTSQLYIGNLKSGLYMVQITDKNQTYFTKLLKE